MKNGQSNARSSSRRIVARMMAGNAKITMPAKMSMVHAKTGIFPIVMPGARVRRTPTMISIAPAMAEISMNPIPSNQKSAPIPEEYWPLVSGGYMNHPPDGARPNRRLVQKIVPPIAYDQNA